MDIGRIGNNGAELSVCCFRPESDRFLWLTGFTNENLLRVVRNFARSSNERDPFQFLILDLLALASLASRYYPMSQLRRRDKDLRKSIVLHPDSVRYLAPHRSGSWVVPEMLPLPVTVIRVTGLNIPKYTGFPIIILASRVHLRLFPTSKLRHHFKQNSEQAGKYKV